MLQVDPTSEMHLDKVSTVTYRSPPSLRSPFQEKSKRQQGSTVTGTGLILVERVLPKARDRLVTIDADAPLIKAAGLLFEPSCRMVVACDSAGATIGVITRTDIIRQIGHCQGCGCATRCMMIMTKRVISCRPTDQLDDIWAIMKEKELHSVPVIDAGRRPIGLLSARDALAALLASVKYEERLLRDYVMGIGYR